jgi:glycosyltransferase involved in cell wall biosynthesis
MPSTVNLPLLSIVVPVFNEAEGIQRFNETLTGVLQKIEPLSYEVIYVDDGSSDDSLAQLHQLALQNTRIKIIKFSRNFGHQIALTAGLDYAFGDAVVFIDSDLQDPPELIPQLVEKWQEGFDVVYARRLKREGESAMKLLTAKWFYRLLGKISQVDIPSDVGDYRLISRRVADRLRLLRETDRYIRGLVSWIGFPQTSVSYDRNERIAGATKYPLHKMIKFAFDGITSFSDAPLRLATWLGYCSASIAFLYLLFVLVQKLLGYTVHGWATIMVTLLFLGGVQLICVGILGEYLGRVYHEVKRRPIYIVEDTIGVSNGNKGLSNKNGSV